MNRNELRFRILFYYYQESYSEDRTKYDVRTKIQKIAVPDHEKNVAQIWLTDKKYVEGSIEYYGDMPVPYISRINSNGTDFVENIVSVTFTKVIDGTSDIKKLSKKERIKKFAMECIESEITGQICKVTFDAITAYTASNGSN